jgi:carbonic anhydrase
VLNLDVARIVVCGHSHCGGIRALYEGVSPRATNLAAWLELGREAVLPVQLGPEALRRTEQRAVVLQLERLMDYPMVRERVEAGRLTLHGWHYVIEDGEVHVFDVKSGQFVPASSAEHSGTGPFAPAGDDAVFNEIDASLYAEPGARGDGPPDAPAR